MNPKERLIKALKDDVRVQRFRELEAQIEHHPTLLKAYELVKKSQQAYVRAKGLNHADVAVKKSLYLADLDALRNNPFVGEYLDLIEELNYDLQWIMGEIQDHINAQLTPPLKATE